jgi:hypothetical protein
MGIGMGSEELKPDSDRGRLFVLKKITIFM